ncbi:MAG: ATP-dependent sacrificial sulfur transferase LarE [Lachnospiraceae bacterium]
MEKKNSLKEFFLHHNRAALAFSGGVDSSYLLYEAVKHGADVQPYYVKSAFQPAFEYEDACRLAESLGVGLQVIEVDILKEKQVTANPSNRCYFCKNRIFTTIIREAAKGGYALVLDGTNASDDAHDRPGMKALSELKVRSPLRECGLTKEIIRGLSKEAGLFTWNKPSYACLATRISTGEEITKDKLTTTERAEEYLFSLGFENFRVRLFKGLARIQLTEKQIPLFMQKREEILKQLKTEYAGVVLDLEVRDEQ